MSARTAPQPGIPARYPDYCGRCSEAIGVGDRIVFHRGRPIHVGCASGQDES